MKTVLKTSIALGLMIVLAAGPYESIAAEAPDLAQGAASQAKTDFTRANALAPVFRFQPAPAVHAPETDGLGRNDDDCRYGCVDH
jgi:hypothetical protein